jgi:hypothetical protein
VKYLVVLALLALVAAYAYWRLRRYIHGALRLVGALREMNRLREGGEWRPDLPQKGKKKKGKKKARRQESPGEMLLRCASCGTWMPASRAVSLRAGTNYCSHACLERAAYSPHKARKSAS